MQKVKVRGCHGASGRCRATLQFIALFWHICACLLFNYLVVASLIIALKGFYDSYQSTQSTLRGKLVSEQLL
jgi:hypothetical protein